MKCPNCNNTIALLKLRHEFACLNCGSSLKCENFGMLTAIGAIGGCVLSTVLANLGLPLIPQIVLAVIAVIVILKFYSNLVVYRIVKDSNKESR